MSRATTYGYLEVVHAPEDIEGTDIGAGDRGTVVEVFERPKPAVLVEYADNEGCTRALVFYSPDLERLYQVVSEIG